MNVFALFSLLSAVICFFLGIFVYSKDSRNLVNIVFTMFCLFGAYAAFTEFVYRQAESFEAAYFWLRMSVLWPFIIVFLLHFVLLFTEHSNLLKNKVTYVFMYGPAIFFILGLILILPRPVKTYWGWTFGTPESTLFLNIFIVWLVGLTILSLYFCTRYYLMVSDHKKKQQAKYVSIGALFPVAIGLLTNWLLPTLSMRIPELATLSFALGSIFIGYAIVKHELFILTPATAAESSINTMPDALLLVSPEGKILSVNQATINLLGYEERELISQPIENVFAEETKTALFKGTGSDVRIRIKRIRDAETIFNTKDGRTIPISLSASMMRDNKGNLRGIVFIGRDITECKRAEEKIEAYTEKLEQLVEWRTLELGESEERYRGLYKSSIDGIVSVDMEGNIMECNQAFADMLGYTREELYNLNFRECVSNKWQDVVTKSFTEQLLLRGYSEEFEEDSRKKDGTIVPVSVRAWLIKDKDGRHTGAWAIVRDITERKQLERQLKEYTENLEAIVEERILELRMSEERYRGLHESSIDGIISVDMEGNIMKCNQAFVDMLGYTKEELYNLIYRELTPSKWRGMDVKILTEQVLLRGYSDEYEKEYIRKDGTIFPVSLRIWLIKDKEGIPTGAWAIVRDITERKQLERKLKKYTENLEASEARYRGLYESSIDGIVFVDLEGNIMECNQAFADMLGYTKEELYNLIYRELTPSKWHDMLDKVIAEQLLLRGYSDEYEKEYRKKDGTIVPVSVRIWPIKDKEGTSIGRWAIVRDIIERKRAEEALHNALEESRQRQAEFSALLEGFRAVLKYREFKDTARSIFDSCKDLTGATAGYVALLSEDGTKNEVLFLDLGGLPCTIDSSLPMPIRGLHAEAYRTGKTVYHNDFSNSEWVKYMPAGHICLDNGLFVPLVIKGKTVGLLGLANKPGGFTENDARMASAFGELASVALYNSWTLESLENSEKRFRSVVQTANDAIITIDSLGNIVSCNHAAETMFGYLADEMIGKPLTLIIPERFRDAYQKGMNRVIPTEKPRFIGKTVEYSGLRKDGSEFPAEFSLATWKISEGAFFTAIVRDITERKKLERQLKAYTENILR